VSEDGSSHFFHTVAHSLNIYETTLVNETITHQSEETSHEYVLIETWSIGHETLEDMFASVLYGMSDSSWHDNSSPFADSVFLVIESE
jgi:hypothetical protein